MKKIEANTRVTVHFHSGRDAEGIVEDWGEDAVLRSLDGSAIIYVPSVVQAVESVEIIVAERQIPAHAPPIPPPLQRTVESISQHYSDNRYRNPFIK